jgi:hypothetical protein
VNFNCLRILGLRLGTADIAFEFFEHARPYKSGSSKTLFVGSQGKHIHTSPQLTAQRFEQTVVAKP